MKPALLILIFCTVTTESFGQIVIRGVIRDQKTRKALPAVNVMLQDISEKSIFGYALTREDGSYSITYAGKTDPLLLVVTGFNIATIRQIIPGKTQIVNFKAEFKSIQLKEVLVKMPPIRRSSDTLNYNVASFADLTDRSIGDVLKKMPGIEVSLSGEIRYNGKAINKFYIEGLDMLEGRYGIATNNIQARDVATVQVLENHQPIKILQELKLSDRAAINLKLKKSVKGTFNATLLLGGGYKPGMWVGEVVTMYFARKFQTLNTYKTNNTGNDVSREMTAFYGGYDPMRSMLGVHTPLIPPVDRNRYLDNHIHTITFNTIKKLNKDTELKTNASYLHDKQLFSGQAVTTYYLPEQSPLIISERTSVSRYTDQADINIGLGANSKKRYAQNHLFFGGKWNRDLGKVVNDSGLITQKYRLPEWIGSNNFNSIKRAGRKVFSFRSVTDFNMQPAKLRVVPLLYPEIFGENEKYENVYQEVTGKRFRTQNSTHFGYTTGTWNFSCRLEANARLEWMNSALHPMSETGEMGPTPDSLQNRMYWQKLEAVAGLGIDYKNKESFQIELQFPFHYLNLYIRDKIKAKNRRKNRLLLNPRLQITAHLTTELKLSAKAAYSQDIGRVADFYSGYIMTDYRVISSKDGRISENDLQNYSVSLSYGNALHSLFASLNASYYRNHSNLMYGTQYIGTLSRIESYALDNVSDGYDLSGKISKYFDGIGMTLTLLGGYSRNFRDLWRQGEIMNTSYRNGTLGFLCSTHLGNGIRFDYDGSYSRSQTEIKGNEEKLAPIDVVRQKASLDFILHRQLIFKAEGEYYYNGNVSSGDRSMFFLDASVRYKTKRVEYEIEGRNLLSNNSFHSANYRDITHYIYSYRLRPCSVLFKLKFSLK